MHTERPATRLHIGCGAAHLRGWVNIDREPFPGVDLVADVTRGLAFEREEVETVYAEHFLEHLAIDDALAFLREVRRVLAPGSRLPHLIHAGKVTTDVHATRKDAGGRDVRPARS